MPAWSTPDWERGIGVAEAHASGPVRVIPVTPAMQERERQRQQTPQNDTVKAWRTHVFAGRDEPAVVEKIPSNAHLVQNHLRTPRQERMKPCAGKCGRNTEHSSGRCYKCRKEVQHG